MKTGSSQLNKIEQEVVINYKDLKLNGILAVPPNSKGLIIFAHGSGSSRWSSRNNYVARELQKEGMATLLMDLLTEEEESDRANVFDIETLSERLNIAKEWAAQQSTTRNHAIGYFGASTGAGAALVAAAKDPSNVFAVVSRGGRPDLASTHLGDVEAPTLLIIGGEDTIVIELNQRAFNQLRSPKEMKIVPRATHLFEEPGTLEQVAVLAKEWFKNCLRTYSPSKSQPLREKPSTRQHL